MKQYFNVYVIMDPIYDTRMFKKNLLKIDVYDTDNYYDNYNKAIEKFNNYKQSYDDKLVLLVENKIPQEGTIYNFVPKKVVELD